jgi:hypothetical protein
LWPVIETGTRSSRRPADFASDLEQLLSELEDGIADGTAYDRLSDSDVQRLLAAATKLYVGVLERRGQLPPFPSGPLVVTPTDAAATASEMLRALQIEVFELGMWQTRGGL